MVTVPSTCRPDVSPSAEAMGVLRAVVSDDQQFHGSPSGAIQNPSNLAWSREEFPNGTYSFERPGLWLHGTRRPLGGIVTRSVVRGRR
jgi:hypothetical protein